VLPLLVAAEATTTTAVPRMVGEPLPDGVVVGSGLVLFAVIAGAGLWLRRRKDDDEDDAKAPPDPWAPGS
jgi:hypothetical protein